MNEIVIDLGHRWSRIGFRESISPLCVVASPLKASNSTSWFVDALDSVVAESTLSLTNTRVRVAESYPLPKSCLASLLEALFEKYKVGEVILADSLAGLASECSQGGTALVVDVGHGHSRVAPIIQGYNAGRYGKTSFRLCGSTALAVADRLGVSDEFKEPESDFLNKLYVSENAANELRIYDSLQSDEHKQAWRFLSPEVFFTPVTSALPQLIVDVTSRCPIDDRRSLFLNILLTGGCSTLPNMARRIKREIMLQKYLADNPTMVSVTNVNDPLIAVWRATRNAPVRASVTAAQYRDGNVHSVFE